MILHWDGSWPLLMVALMITFFFMTRKEAKENKKIQNNIDKISDKLKEREFINTQAGAGVKTFIRSDFKQLNDNELKLYTDICGVKFI